MSHIFVYVACKDLKQARKIAGLCVESRLVASANIFPNMESFYWWDGQVNHEQEVVVILKTLEKHFEAVKNAVLENHSYECPCIVAIPVTDGHTPYMNWMWEETHQ